MLSGMSSLYILDINPLSNTSFVNIFPNLGGYIFVLLIVSFTLQKLFSFVVSHLFSFAFFSPCLKRYIQKTKIQKEKKNPIK